MSFSISFNAPKPKLQPANRNVHDAAAWEVSHNSILDIAPLDKLPRQFAVHYMYEYLNRPWLTDEQNAIDAAKWADAMEADLADPKAPVRLCPIPASVAFAATDPASV